MAAAIRHFARWHCGNRGARNRGLDEETWIARLLNGRPLWRILLMLRRAYCYLLNDYLDAFGCVEGRELPARDQLAKRGDLAREVV